MTLKDKVSYTKLIKKLPTIDKDRLCRIISEKTNVSYDHVCSIVNLLLDEIQRELKNSRSVRIINFGRLDLIQPKSKKIVNINTGEHQVVERKRKLKFVLDRALSSFLSKFVEME
jgi:nucleoid DNA-binding protein